MYLIWGRWALWLPISCSSDKACLSLFCLFLIHVYLNYLAVYRAQPLTLQIWIKFLWAWASHFLSAQLQVLHLNLGESGCFGGKASCTCTSQHGRGSGWMSMMIVGKLCHGWSAKMTPNVLSETLSHLCSRANQQLLSLLPSPATMAFMTHLHAQVSKHLVSISCVFF